MAQQNIDFGTFPNDPTADPIRIAFQKTQDNFDELYAGLTSAAVQSINRVPGAGITVSAPTGNVIVSANIACVQVSTSTLSIGRGGNGGTYTSITSSNQTLVIDIDPDNVRSNNFSAPDGGLASLNGTLTAQSYDQPNITNVGTLTGLVVSGNSNLGNVATANYFIGDGSGLSNVPAGAPVEVVHGNSNIVVNANSTIVFSSAGTASVLVVSNTGSNVEGNLSVSGNITSNNANLGNLAQANYFTGTLTTNAQPNITSVGVLTSLSSTGNIDSSNINTTGVYAITVAGELTTAAQPNITSVGELTSLVVDGNINAVNISGGNLVSANYFSGDGGLLTNLNLGTSSTLVNGTSNVTVDNNGNVRIGINGTPNVMIVKSTGANVAGTLGVSGNANVGNIGGHVGTFDLVYGIVSSPSQPSITSLGTLTSLSVTGTANLGSVSNVKITGGGSNYYLMTDGSGNLSWNNATLQPVGGTNTQVQFNDNGTYSGNTGFTFNKVTGNLNAPGNIVGGNLLSANYVSGVLTTGAQPNITQVGTLSYLIVNGNINAVNVSGGNLVSANYFTGTITTAAQPNITSVGTLTSLSVSGNITSNNFVGEFKPSTGTGNNGIIFPSTDPAEPEEVAYIQYYEASDEHNIFELGVVDQSEGYVIKLNASGGTIVTNTLAADYFAGEGGNISNIQGANVSGTVNSATHAGTVSTAAQPNITSVGTLTSLSVSGNLNVNNTISSANIKTTHLYSNRSAIPVITDTIVDTFPSSQYRSAKYTMRAGNGVDYQALEVLLVHNDINSIITIYGSLSTSDSDLVVFTSDISAGNVNVYCTAVGPNTNLNLMGTYVQD